MKTISSRAELCERLKDVLAVEMKAHDSYEQDLFTFKNFIITDTIKEIRNDEERHIKILQELILMLENE